MAGSTIQNQFESGGSKKWRETLITGPGKRGVDVEILLAVSDSSQLQGLAVLPRPHQTRSRLTAYLKRVQPIGFLVQITSTNIFLYESISTNI